ncbi:hypothetical protein [Ammoniphilus resinae]|uniref:Uncharacterized protein n=1 Tax=Ammoniphilus resinae TaxID=861532 RepID=A0ABS4GP39_9BACL|nr:hypothetical protein [Ammoniphilus resinae]MBP1932045.1 hypothetical protein [Ammoniphilus resinae]
MIIPPEEVIENIKQYALLPLLLSVFEKDRKLIYSSGIKTMEPYVSLMEQTIKRVEEDLNETKRYFYKNGVKVYEEERTSDGIQLKYLYRGYQHTANYPLENQKGPFILLMKKYLGVE